MYRHGLQIIKCNHSSKFIFEKRFGFSENSFVLLNVLIDNGYNRKYGTSIYNPGSLNGLNHNSPACIKNEIYLAHGTNSNFLGLHRSASKNIIQVRNFSFESAIRPISELALKFIVYLSESTVVAYFKDAIITLHTITGIPWWATIVLTTVLLRTCVTVPLALYQQLLLAKVENLKEEMKDRVLLIKNRMPRDIRLNSWTQKQARLAYRTAVKKQWNELVVRDNCHPLKAGVLVWFQLPMWLITSAALRNMVFKLPEPTEAAEAICAELSTGGTLWFPDLIMADGTYILPLLFGFANLAVIQIQVYQHSDNPSIVKTIVTFFFRGLTILMIPVAAQVPSALCLYWATSSMFGLGQNFLLLSPKLRRFFNIPKTLREKDRPYHHLVVQLNEQISRIPGFRHRRKKHDM